MVYGTAVEVAPLWGGEVALFQGNEYWVKKVNPKNFVIVAVKTGKTYNLRRTAKITKVDRQLTEDERKTVGALTYAEKVAVKQETGLRVGAIVLVINRPSSSKFTYNPLQKFVVIKETSDLLHIVPVGGFGIGWRMVPSSLKVVSL